MEKGVQFRRMGRHARLPPSWSAVDGDKVAGTASSKHSNATYAGYGITVSTAVHVCHAFQPAGHSAEYLHEPNRGSRKADGTCLFDSRKAGYNQCSFQGDSHGNQERHPGRQCTTSSLCIINAGFMREPQEILQPLHEVTGSCVR